VLITYLTFSSIFIELVYVMASIWRHYFYFLFAFLYVIMIVLVLISSEIAVIFTYIQLCQ